MLKRISTQFDDSTMIRERTISMKPESTSDHIPLIFMDESYALSHKRKKKRVRDTVDDEFRIKLVSINSVRASQTISSFQAFVRPNAPGRRDRKCRSSDTYVFWIDFFKFKAWHLTYVSNDTRDLESHNVSKNITSDEWTSDIYVDDTTRILCFIFYFFKHHHLWRISSSGTGLSNYTRIHWTFSRTSVSLLNVQQHL